MTSSSSGALSAPSLFDLAGRVAIVTGGTRGIGRALAQGLAEAGAGVVLTGRDAAVCEAVAAEIAAATGCPVAGIRAEMSVAGDLEAVVEGAVARFGRLDVLVNNAGVAINVSVDRVDSAALRETFDVNVVAPLLLAQAAVPHMRALRRGSIVNILSAQAFLARPGNSVYAASKAALLSLTRAAAAQWAPDGIRVNAIVPGATETDMSRALPPEQRERVAAATLLNRLGEPADLVGAAIFLAGDASRYVTGQALSVDGGLIFR